MHTLFLALFFIFNPLCDIANGRENHALNLLRGAIDGVENGPVKKWIILKSNALQNIRPFSSGTGNFLYLPQQKLK